MLTSLRIQGFRGFADYSVEHLARVNLFVGANNSGKTSILEAAETLLGRGRIESVIAGPLRREEGVFDQRQNPQAFELGHLFFGRPTAFPATFTVSGVNGEAQAVKVLLELDVGSDEEGGKTSERRQRRLDLDQEQPLGSQLMLETEFEFTQAKQSFVQRVPVEEIPRLLSRKWIRAAAVSPLSAPSQQHPVNFIPTSGLSAQALAERWNRLALTPQEQFVVEAMQIIEPRTERLAFLQDPAQVPRVMLKMRDSLAPVPLGSMGEGMRRLLALAIGLGTSAGGCLVIDELDTGLHYGAMQRLWKLLIEGAKRLDVQVLATTHSLDCIRALAAFAEENPDHRDDVLLHRVEAKRDRAITFTADEVCIAVRNESELRGWLE